MSLFEWVFLIAVVILTVGIVKWAITYDSDDDDHGLGPRYPGY